jgi:hypothetical protein
MYLFKIQFGFMMMVFIKTRGVLAIFSFAATPRFYFPASVSAAYRFSN